LTLAAQYESYVLPFIVLLAVPVAILGAVGAQALRGLQNDVYCQIGLVMLIGLASKNAILIVEFAEQFAGSRHVRGGCGRGGGEIRLRPILMTSLAVYPGRCAAGFGAGGGARRTHLRWYNRFRRNDRGDDAESDFSSRVYVIREGYRSRPQFEACCAKGVTAGLERVCSVRGVIDIRRDSQNAVEKHRSQVGFEQCQHQPCLVVILAFSAMLPWALSARVLDPSQRARTLFRSNELKKTRGRRSSRRSDGYQGVEFLCALFSNGPKVRPSR